MKRRMTIGSLFKIFFFGFCIAGMFVSAKEGHIKQFCTVISGIVAAWYLFYGFLSGCSYAYYKMELKDGNYQKITANAVGMNCDVFETRQDFLWSFEVDGVSHNAIIEKEYLIEKYGLKFDINSKTDFYYAEKDPDKTIWCMEVKDVFNSFISCLSGLIPFTIAFIVLLVI